MKVMRLTKSLIVSSFAIGFATMAIPAVAQQATTPTVSITPVPSAKMSANDVLRQAELKARKEHKAVFLLFHASWCIWCHRIDDMLSDPTLKPIFDKNFVVIHIDGMEAKKKANLENPGWAPMLDKYHGTGQGIPYWLFLSPKGKVLADCNSPYDPDKNGKPSNMGFPDKSQPKDLNFFIHDLQKAGAKLSKKDIAAIKSYLHGLTY